MSFFEDTKKFINFDTLSYLVEKLRDENQSTYMNSNNHVNNEDIDSIFGLSEPEYKKYLTIEALEDDLTVSLSVNDCEYCVDEDGDWKTLSTDTPTESINAGQTLSFRGNLEPNPDNGIGTFTISKKCNVSGNVMSMLFGDDAHDSLSLSGKDYAFPGLFSECTTIISAKDLYLPATTLAEWCYAGMFYGCTSLTTAPKLPATTLVSGDYDEDCVGYGGEEVGGEVGFIGADYCYANMFQYCESLTTAPELPATTLANSCYSHMFEGCTSLTTAPELPATTLAESCYGMMFQYCESLTTAPELPATTLASGCYYGMFYDCNKLNYIKMLATDISAYGCLIGWVEKVANTGTFVKHPDMTLLPTGESGIPKGWTVQDAA